MWLHRKKGSVAPAEQVTAFPTLVTGFGLPQTYTNMIDSSGLQIDANYLPTITQRLTINTSSTDSYDVIINRGTTVWFTASNLTGNSLFDEGVDMKLNKVYAYRITFFGQTVNVKDILREDKLGNLSDLNQYNLNYDAATVKARLQSASGAILCPLITSGASGEESRLFYNSNTSAGS